MSPIFKRADVKKHFEILISNFADKLSTKEKAKAFQAAFSTKEDSLHIKRFTGKLLAEYLDKKGETSSKAEQLAKNAAVKDLANEENISSTEFALKLRDYEVTLSWLDQMINKDGSAQRDIDGAKEAKEKLQSKLKEVKPGGEEALIEAQRIFHEEVLEKSAPREVLTRVLFQEGGIAISAFLANLHADVSKSTEALFKIAHAYTGEFLEKAKQAFQGQ